MWDKACFEKASSFFNTCAVMIIMIRFSAARAVTVFQMSRYAVKVHRFLTPARLNYSFAKISIDMDALLKKSDILITFSIHI